MVGLAFQDQIKDNNCFGCGPANPQGLQIKSYWVAPKVSTCTYQPHTHQSAGPPQFLNGGIIATLIDCHCVCTAIAYGYHLENREIGSRPSLWYVTGKLTVSYLKPTPITPPVILTGRIVEATEKKTIVECTLASDGEDCAEGEVIAIRVPPTWKGSP